MPCKHLREIKVKVMDIPNRYVRFQDELSEKSFGIETEWSSDDDRHRRRNGLTMSSVVHTVQSGLGRGSQGIKKFRKSFSFHPKIDHLGKDLGYSKTGVLDPQGHFLQKWNKIFVILCAVSLAFDPLFFYIPVIDGSKMCLALDKKLEIVGCVLRSFTDIFYLLHIIFQFRTGFIAPHTLVFGRGELIVDPSAIAKRYLSSYFIVDILAVLPIPQALLLIIMPRTSGPVSLITKNWLTFIVMFQYVPRLIRMIPLFREVTRTSGIITETAWAGAVFNLLLYMLASHAVGAVWYLFSVERVNSCWRGAFELKKYNVSELYCHMLGIQNNTISLSSSCPFVEADPENLEAFDFGIFLDALTSRVVQTQDFPKKLFYCFWWGLRGLSSLGQNLKTSTYVWEILFAVFISIFGLVLFSLLIGNMQKYLQSTAVRVEEMRVKRRDAELWMSHRLLPESLKERIRKYQQYKWQETRGVEEDALIGNLPKDLRRDIKRHLCLDLVTRVPMFEKMDKQLLDAMCDRLKPVLYIEKSYILREDDPVDEMLLIIRGNLSTSTTNGGRTGFFNSDTLKGGDFCGEELLTWALDPKSSQNLPTSTRTVQSITEVEAFALMADDLKEVASQYRRLLNSKQLQHTFRFCSQTWKTWAACFIQSAWRQFHKRKIEEALRQEEEDRMFHLAKEGESPTSLIGALYASKFALNIMRPVLRNGARRTRMPGRLPPSPLPKPAEPDFTVIDS